MTRKKRSCADCAKMQTVYIKEASGKLVEYDRKLCEWEDGHVFTFDLKTECTCNCKNFEPRKTAIYLTREELNEMQKIITQCKKALSA